MEQVVINLHSIKNKNAFIQQLRYCIQDCKLDDFIDCDMCDENLITIK